MQVDWAGTKMVLVDPITRTSTPVSVFVASLPYSGMVFAYGYLDERQRSGVMVISGRSSTSAVWPTSPFRITIDRSNQISKTERTRDVNATYAQFLEYYRHRCGADPFSRPRDKGHVEPARKVVTNWAIH